MHKHEPGLVRRKTYRAEGLLLLAISLIFIGWAGSARSETSVGQTLPPSYVPSGRLMYKQYCATCHGLDAKGDGPFSSMLKVPPADLTTLAERHGGRFPFDYVANVLRFGPGPRFMHGSADMPTWGPIFQYFDKNNERAVERRIKNLCDYLASLQEQ